MIRYANENDIEIISKYDKHISKEELVNIIKLKRVIVMYEGDKFVGWLRYNLFWDNTPFMNMLYLLDNERGKGNGSRLVIFWENEMKQKNYEFVLTSTQSNEEAQFFYRKIGYVDSGALLLPNEPLEIIFYKKL
ncbi:MAG TPA: GNAT family N-acetyltransferase [Candidatus Aphodocola excrementigallinarum]|uniref:GNAT family N-acetyltransferase n=1 Tax=Candidatus Aphodocola excrementigallinarum TaxID=2840670 RepID=A0A9D1INK9_9FIRM|nr:GNAT family N-acetyltransferase [Candidatus Aphodocola excrementigallinarum]